MATDKKLTELTFRETALNQDLLYLVSYDANGDPESLAINAAGLLKGVVTGVNRIISGAVVYTGTGYQFKSIKLVYEINGFIYYSDGDTITNDAPDATNPRLDVAYVDSSGLSIEKGTPAVTPIEPALTLPGSQLKTNLILVQNGTTTPPEISVDTMYSENLQEVGGEWDTAESTSGVRILLGSTTNPINLTKDIRVLTTALDGDWFSLEHSTPLTIATINNIRMRFRSLQKWNKDYLQLTFYDGATVVATAFVYSTSFPTNNLVTIYDVYLQDAEILWVPGETQFDKIVFTCTDDGKGTMRTAFQVDEIAVQYGGTDTTPQPTLIEASDVVIDSTTTFTGVLSGVTDNVLDALDVIDILNLDDLGNPVSAKASPIDADSIVMIDSADSDTLKEVTNTNLKAYLKTYFDGLYGTGSGDMLLAGVQTVTGLKTFDTSKLAMKGSSTGVTTVASANAGASNYVATLQAATGTVAYSADIDSREQILIVAFSDETTVVDAGTAKVTFTMPNYATTLTGVAVSFIVAPTTDTVTIDLNEGVTSVLSTKITVDATEFTSETAATPPVISDSSLAANAIMSVDVDTQSTGATEKGGKIILYFNKA